jgi:hypothetical protein
MMSAGSSIAPSPPNSRAKINTTTIMSTINSIKALLLFPKRFVSGAAKLLKAAVAG